MLPRFVLTQYPPFDEEYFEWVALMEAASTAVGQFVMVELGAGWGRWLVNATAAIAHISGVPCRLVGVEADPTHFRWMGVHFRDNGIDVQAHELIEAAVSDKDGEAWFYAGRPAKWYGQTFANGPDPRAGWATAPRWMRVNKVQTVTLEAVLRRYERVDLIDADIQGAELAVFAAAREVLDQRVRSVCIMTHEPPDSIEAGLREIFRSLGWTNVADYSCGALSDTSWGRIRFRDGVQRWINPKLW